ncbi:hypothetical protein HY745_12105 [Candidatus Desantisbacteria bacterium]|nr:hypothetical protein [Candidatus Desantisbacteria bacterium]
MQKMKALLVFPGILFLGLILNVQLPVLSFAEDLNYDMYEYRPLTVGTSWNYTAKGLMSFDEVFAEKVVREEDYSGVKVVLVRHGSGWIDYLEKTDEGIKRYKHVGPDSESYGVYYPPAIQYPRYIKINDIYSRENILKDFSIKDDSLIGEVKEVFTFQLLGIEDVTTPAGNYKDCLKTLSKWKIYNQNGEQVRDKVLLTWSAKGIGNVKAIYSKHRNGVVVDFSEWYLTNFDIK